MKRKDFLALKMKSKAELESELASTLQKVKVLQFNLALGKVKNQKELRALKKAIARFKTLLSESH